MPYFANIIKNCLLFFTLLLPKFFLSQTTFTYTSSGTFVVPYGVTSVTVECYGAGGGGGGDGTDNSVGGSGGGGGAYARSVVAVTPGASYSYSIGTAGTAGAGAAGGNGGNTTFNTTTVVAAGGSGGGANGAAGGAGGTAAASTGDVEYEGGAGATSADVNGRGGGGSGGTASIGNIGGDQAGATAVTGGYAGGAGGTGDGANGSAPAAVQYGGGGGGSGDRSGASRNGGAGLAGYIKITYTGAAQTLRIGASGDDFTSITAARTALGTAGVDGPIIIEIQSDYSEAGETYPITFSAVTGASATNTITYRPASGVTGLVSGANPGSAASLFTFDGADYIILDGSAGGLGTTISDIQWTIRNERTAVTVGSVFELKNDAVSNVLKYLNVEGEAGSNALVYFSATTGATGNDGNTISKCKLQDLTSGGSASFPVAGVASVGTDTKETSGNIIDNCHFIDVFGAGAGQGSRWNIIISTDNDAWTITNNHFYHNNGTTLPAIAFVHGFIDIESGGGYTVTGNYLGGRSSSCEGSAYTVTGSERFYPLYFASTVSGTACVVSSNIVQNIALTSTYAGTCFVGIRLHGGANFTCGSSGQANTIGKMDATGSISITNNTVSGTNGSMGIYSGASGSNSIAYNNIGGFTFAGTRTGTNNDMIYIASTTGTTTIDNNTIGGTIANSIDMTIASELHGIYSLNTTAVTITNNTFQYFRHRAADETTIIWNTDGTLTCTGNTIRNITTDADKKVYLIAHGSVSDPSTTTLVESATVSSNTIQDITLSNTGTTAQLLPIFINSSGTITCNSNTIGSASANNISLAPAMDHYAIYFKGNGTITCNSNTIQQVNTINSSTGSSFNPIYNADGILSSCTSNTIKNITSAGNKVHYMIFHSNTDNASITGNTIQDITLSGTGASELRAIYVNTSGTITVSTNTIGSTTNNNIFLAGAAVHYGILLDGNGTITCSSNTIQEFNLTETSVSTGFKGIFNADGTISACNSNTIANISSAGGATVQYGIQHAGTADAAAISSNTISDIALTSSTSGFYGIQTNTAGVTTISSNTIGSTTNNNITSAGDTYSAGIRVITSNPTTLSVSSNTIQEFNLTNTGLSAEFNGIYVSVGTASAVTISSNIITNIDNAGTNAGTIIRGIYYSAAIAGAAINSNTISSLNATTTSASSPVVYGITLLSGSGGGNLKKNLVKNLTNTATTSPGIGGIYLLGSWTMHNNVILISNGANTNNVTIRGLRDLSQGTITVYHNTVKISGSASVGSLASYAYHREGTLPTSITVKNNIFQNLRSGGTGDHNAYYAAVTTGITTDYNYLEVSADASKVANWGGANYSFTNWKTAFAGEDNSLNGTNTIAANGSAAADFTGANMGENINATVSDDKAGTARNDGTPWMGAFEGVNALPMQLVHFSGYRSDRSNELIWKTASELNNDYFTIEKTFNGIDFELVGFENGSGNSNQLLNYKLTDYNVKPVVNYYRLKQTDFDGQTTWSDLISIDNSVLDISKEIVLKVNILGQEVNDYYKGLVVILYSDGTSVKVIQ